MRITVDFSKDEIEGLDIYAKFKSISRAAAVRVIVSMHVPMKKAKNLNYWLNHPSFGSEKMAEGFDSVEYVRKLRAEWDHRG